MPSRSPRSPAIAEELKNMGVIQFWSFLDPKLSNSFTHTGALLIVRSGVMIGLLI